MLTGLGNPVHLALILTVLLLVFGAKRLPEMGKSLGTGLRDFKDSLSGEHSTPALVASASEPIAAPAHPAGHQVPATGTTSPVAGSTPLS